MISSIQRLGELMAEYEQVTLRKGRSVSAFGREGGGCYELARAAYCRRFTHCKILAALDQEKGEREDLLRQVANASARRILWIFMHECLPNYPGREAAYAALRARNNANLLIQGIQRIVTERLEAGDPTEEEFSARALDDGHFYAFAASWLSRPKGSRSR
jgi:hypothetical protein